jgi:hypothetical protein
VNEDAVANLSWLLKRLSGLRAARNDHGRMLFEHVECSFLKLELVDDSATTITATIFEDREEEQVI